MEGAYKTQLDHNLVFMRQNHAEQIQNLMKIIRQKEDRIQSMEQETK